MVFAPRFNFDSSTPEQIGYHAHLMKGTVRCSGVSGGYRRRNRGDITHCRSGRGRSYAVGPWRCCWGSARLGRIEALAGAVAELARVLRRRCRVRRGKVTPSTYDRLLAHDYEFRLHHENAA